MHAFIRGAHACLRGGWLAVLEAARGAAAGSSPRGGPFPRVYEYFNSPRNSVNLETGATDRRGSE